MSTALVTCRACGQKNRVPSAATGTPRCGSCREPLAWIAEAGDGSWQQVAEASPLPVLVDFWAEWCGPCRMVGPALEEVAVDYAGRLKLVKVNVDEAPALSQRFGVQSIPTLALLHRGRVVSRQVGAAGAAHLRRWVDGALTDLSGSG